MNQPVGQMSLFDLPPEAAPIPMPDLGSYDVIIVNSSAGKDSQAARECAACR